MARLGRGFPQSTRFQRTKVVPIVALAETLTDDFNDNSVDTGKWSVTGTGLAETNNRIEITSGTSPQYGGLLSVNTFNLTGSYIYAKVLDAGNQSLASFEVDVAYIVPNSGGSPDWNNQLYWSIDGGLLVAAQSLGGVGSNLRDDTAYNSSLHKYFRLREASGTIYWDYSADGVSWTNYHSVAAPFAITDVFQTIYAGNGMAEGSATTAIIDNYNTGVDRLIVAAGISAASTVAGNVAAIRRVTPAAISATSAVSGDVAKLAAIAGVISATSNVSGAVVRLKPIVAAAISATSTVSGYIKPTEFPRLATNIDTFNRPAENPCSDGGKWTANALNLGFGAFKTDNFNAIGATAGVWHDMYRNDLIIGPDFELQTDFPGSVTSEIYIGVLRDPATAGVDGYRIGWKTSTTRIDIYRVDNGTSTSIANTTSTTFVTGDKIGFERIGDRLSVWKYETATGIWSRVLTTTDSTYPTLQGSPAMGMLGTGVALGDFIGGNVAGVRAITPAAINSTSAVSGSVAKVVIVPVAAISASSTVNGSVSGIRRITTAAISATSTVSGNVTALKRVTPTTISAASTVSGVISQTKPITPAAISATSSVSGYIKPTPFPRLATVIDNFNRTAENPCSDGGKWTANSLNQGLVAFKTDGLNALGATAGVWHDMYRNDLIIGADFELQASFPAAVTSEMSIGVVRDPATSGVDGYRVHYKHAQTTVQIMRIDNITTTVIASNTSVSFATDDIIGFERVGNRLSAWKYETATGQWTRVLTVTDSTYPTLQGNPMMAIFGTGLELDNFIGGNIAGVRVIAPDNINATSSVSGGVAKVAKITGAISATSTISGSVSKLAHVITPAQISATSTVSGSVAARKRIPPAAISATTTVSGGIAHPIFFTGAVSATATVSGSIKGFLFPQIATSIDNFNRTAENPVSDSGAWTANALNQGFSAFQTTGQYAQGISSGTWTDAYRNDMVIGSDFELQVTFPGTVTSEISLGVLRDPALSVVCGYRVAYRHSPARIAIFRVDNTVNTEIASTTGTSFATGDKIGFEKIGNRLTVYKWTAATSQWSRILQVTDSTYRLLQGNPHMGLFGTSVLLDNLTGGELAGLEPFVVANINAFSSVSGEIIRAAAVAGAISAASTVSANVTGPRHVIPAAISATSVVAASISVSFRLYGDISATSEVLGRVIVTRAVAGVISAASSVSGGVISAHAIAGNVAATSSVSGGVAVRRPISGNIIAASTVSGAIGRIRPLIAAGISASAVVSGRVVKRFLVSGNISAVSTVSGAVTVRRRISGNVTATSTVTGVLAAKRGIAGAITAVSTVSGSVVREPGLAGLISATSIVSGAIGRIRRITTAAISAFSTVSGRIGRIRPLVTGNVTATSTVTGSLRRRAALIGNVTATSSVTGSILRVTGIAGNITATSSVSGEIEKFRGLAGAITATSTVSGSLTKTGATAVAGNNYRIEMTAVDPMSTPTLVAVPKATVTIISSSDKPTLNGVM